MWEAWEQIKENCLICVLYLMTVWMCGPAVIDVKDEEQRWEDAALRKAWRSDRDIGEGVIDQHPLWSVGEEVCNGQDQLVVLVEAGGEFLCKEMCGCRVLNAEEKSSNSSLAVVLGCSRCLCTVTMMSASSTPLPAWYSNWIGFISGLDMTLSIAFITREVRATGLGLFRALTELFLQDGDHCGVLVLL